MNKNSIAAIAGGAAAICVAVATVIWYGNQPIKEYYPNESIKSITQRKMFQHTGKYQRFSQDGTLIEEYEQIKGVKNGKAAIYFKGGSAEFAYADDKINGPFEIKAPEYEEYLNEVEVNFDNSEMQIKNGKFFEIGAKITCADEQFVAGLQSFLDDKNYDNFQTLFKCLNINNASLTSEEGKCEYKGSYNFPKFLTNSSLKCEATNVEALKDYTPDFDAVSDINTDFADTDNLNLNVGDVGNIENIKFDTSYNIKTGKISFDLNTVSDEITANQKVSFGGFEQLLESALEFAFSPQEDADSKKLLVSVLKNLSWSDWSATTNNHKRFTIVGDFNFVNGFSDPYTMSYYSDGEVTTQWKFDGKGTRISSKYPHTDKPMMSFGLNVNDSFKKAYKNLVNFGINAVTTDFSTFDPSVLEKLQTEAIDLVKGVSSVSGILMNADGQKTISAVMALQKNINLEEFMLAPTQFMNFKITTYKNDQPAKVYVGNFNQGFIMNGRKLTDDEIQVEMQNVAGELQSDIDAIIAELGKTYENIDEANMTWLNSDVDPFLFGFYKGYTGTKEQATQVQSEYFDEPVYEEPMLEVSEPAPTPEVSEPAPAPEVSEPAPAPEVSEPAPTPEVSEPAPAPEVSEPAPAPEVSEPAPTPEVSEPAPAPEVSEPAPAPEN